MSDSSKAAYERFKFKNRVCFKKCGIWEGKGGYCKAEKDNIDFCLGLEKEITDSRVYRSTQTVIDFIEMLAEEKGIVIIISKHLRDIIDAELKNDRADCFGIAEKIVERMYTNR